MTERQDGTPEIRLTELTKHFRDVRAVDRVSMDIRSGEFFSMLGPSGCGKTTTLRMIGAFETARRVGEALDLVHLTGYDRRRPNQLSGGQQQRVALARSSASWLERRASGYPSAAPERAVVPAAAFARADVRAAA
jgi:ABC-type Fe3+/spermidine/putrescine transport system ATPase subunit